MAGVLRDAGLDVEIHDDHFAPDAKDEEGLSAVGRKQNGLWLPAMNEAVTVRLRSRQSGVQKFVPLF